MAWSRLCGADAVAERKRCVSASSGGDELTACDVHDVEIADGRIQHSDVASVRLRARALRRDGPFKVSAACPGMRTPYRCSADPRSRAFRLAPRCTGSSCQALSSSRPTFV